MIRVRDMLSQMLMKTTDGVFVPFSVTFVTCDVKRGTGGKKITIDSAILEGGPKSNSKLRNPNHYRNYTRNIRATTGDKTIKVHALLITRFNGAKIIL